MFRGVADGADKVDLASVLGPGALADNELRERGRNAIPVLANGPARNESSNLTNFLGYPVFARSFDQDDFVRVGNKKCVIASRGAAVFRSAPLAVTVD